MDKKKEKLLKIMRLDLDICSIYIERFKNYNYKTILDACAGSGTLSIELANKIKNCKVVSVEKDTYYYRLIKNKIPKNQNISLINQDILELQLSDKIDGAFLDPDWKRIHRFSNIYVDFERMEPPLKELLIKVKQWTENIALRLPKETDLDRLDDLLFDIGFENYELERYYLKAPNQSYLKFITIYSGNLIKKESYKTLVYNSIFEKMLEA